MSTIPTSVTEEQFNEHILPYRIYSPCSRAQYEQESKEKKHKVRVVQSG
jgi:hypothetical protein